MTVSAPTSSVGPVRAQRVAELVAQRLRERILRGELADGEMLPKEDDLRAEYPVSKPSLREALRILETEGLITVMRGNKGGALVHRPTEVDAGYMLGLVLTGQRTEVADLAAALQEIEPACAALCAARRDRKRVVVPVLEDLHAQALAAVDDLVATTTLSRRFHETIVEHCGNRTLTLVAGALETLWSSHERRWAAVVDREAVPVRARSASWRCTARSSRASAPVIGWACGPWWPTTSATCSSTRRRGWAAARRPSTRRSSAASCRARRRPLRLQPGVRGGGARAAPVDLFPLNLLIDMTHNGGRGDLRMPTSRTIVGASREAR